MKKLRLSQTFRVIAFAALSCSGQAQQQDIPVRALDQTYTFDTRGDATIETGSQFSASEWSEWKDRYGDHPDILLRDLRYQFASAVVDDYSLVRDDVHRHAVAKIKARALAKYRSNGDFAIDVTKDLKLVTGSGSDWFFTSSAAINGVLVTQTLNAKLPSGATKAAFSQPGGDFNQLTYSIDLTPSKPKGWLMCGIGLLSLAVILGVCSALLRKAGTKTVTIIPPPPTAPPPIPNLPSGS